MSVLCQETAFAIGVPPDIYAFHRYTRNSVSPSHTQARQYLCTLPSWARKFHHRLIQPPTYALRLVIPSNARHLRITAAAGTKLAVAFSEGTVIFSSPPKGVYNPKTFILHAASLDQGSPHCPKFPTAASRRSLDRVSVPVCPFTLSGRIPVFALVGRCPTN